MARSPREGGATKRPRLVADSPRLVADSPRLMEDSPRLTPDSPRLVGDSRLLGASLAPNLLSIMGNDLLAARIASYLEGGSEGLSLFGYLSLARCSTSFRQVFAALQSTDGGALLTFLVFPWIALVW
jgi:hypothetical protein